MTKQKQHNAEAQAQGFFYRDPSVVGASVGPESQQRPSNVGLTQNQTDQPRVIGVQDSSHTWKGISRPIDPARIMSVGSQAFRDEAVFIVIVIVILVITFGSAGSVLSLAMMLAFMVLVIAVVAYIAVIKIKQYNKENDILQEFALKNSFKFDPGRKKNVRPGSLFLEYKDGISHTHIQGVYGGLNFSMFGFSYSAEDSTLTSRTSKTRQAFVMELTLPRTFPHMVIDSLIESERAFRPSTLPISFDKSQRMKLEGNFYKYFEVYAPDNHAVTLLAMIAPNVMETLMQHATKYDIEIIDDRIYFYTNGEKITGELIMETFITAQQVLDKIGKKLRAPRDFYGSARLTYGGDHIETSPKLKKGIFKSLPEHVKRTFLYTGIYIAVVLFVNFLAPNQVRDTFLSWLFIVFWIALLSYSYGVIEHYFRKK